MTIIGSACSALSHKWTQRAGSLKCSAINRNHYLRWTYAYLHACWHSYVYATIVWECIRALIRARTHDHTIVYTYVNAYKHRTHTRFLLFFFTYFDILRNKFSLSVQLMMHVLDLRDCLDGEKFVQVGGWLILSLTIYTFWYIEICLYIKWLVIMIIEALQ